GSHRCRCAPARSGFLCLLAAGALGWLASTACGASRQWTGAGGDNLFSNTNNWNPVGALQRFDYVFFPAGADAYNDISSVTFGSLIFTGTGTVRISGSRIEVGSIDCLLASGLAQIDLD